MSDSKVISFRAGGHFLNWIEAQQLDGESPSQAAQRILKEISGVSTALSTMSTLEKTIAVSTLSTSMSTPDSTSVMSTDLSTDTAEIVDKLIGDRLDPVMERMAALEERLGKLRA